jgi:hypothetical protein
MMEQGLYPIIMLYMLEIFLLRYLMNILVVLPFVFEKKNSYVFFPTFIWEVIVHSTNTYNVVFFPTIKVQLYKFP